MLAILFMLGFVATALAADPASAPATVAGAWDQLVIAVLGILGTAVTAAGGYVIVLGRSWVKAKISKIQNDEVRGGIEHALKRLEALIVTAVSELNQTTRPDGALTVEMQRALKGRALREITAQLTPWMKETLQVALPDLERYIAGRIEARVGKAKGCA
jgi:hypothetical protein